MSGLDKILDRVRKMLALAEHSDSEAEAALAASRAAKLMEEYQLTEALVRLDNPNAKPEPILRNERLEPNAPETGRKRVAWKEVISHAVAKDLGVHEFFMYKTYWTGNTMRTSADVRGFGRETAIQTWRYTCEYLWRTIDELADKAWRAQDENERGGDDMVASASMGETRAWKNGFRTGCASRIAERIHTNRKETVKQARHEREVVLKAQAEAMVDGTDDGTETAAVVRESNKSLALTVIEKDQAEVDSEYKVLLSTFKRTATSIGSTSSHDGYSSGRAAGDRVSLGGKRAALGAGQGRLKP